MELILIRHGLPEVEINADGTPADPPLSDEGHQQAARMAAWMTCSGIERLYSSPMRRARETAAPLAGALGLDVEQVDAVAEFDRDEGSYIPIELMKEMDPQRYREVVSYDADERVERFQTEVVDGLTEIAAGNRGRKVAVACHGGVINVWAAHVIGLPPRLFFNPFYTSINRFLIAGTGEQSVLSLNEQSHLHEHG